MSRWKALPAELDPRVRQLLVRLRRLKDHSGLSLGQLAAKTGYSPKSWERYLGGRSLPPREAVEAMARIGGDDPTRLLALHEVAAEAWRTGRAAASTPEAPVGLDTTAETSGPVETETSATTETAETVGRVRRGPSLRTVLVAGAVALLPAVAVAVLSVVRLSDGDGRTVVAATAPPKSSPSPSQPPSTPTYTCRVERIGGQWHAGISRTQEAVLSVGNAGPDVAEAQCLLRRAGISPGGIDGLFGPQTQDAVKRLQKRAGLVVDGSLGPHTWKALRG